MDERGRLIDDDPSEPLKARVMTKLFRLCTIANVAVIALHFLREAELMRLAAFLIATWCVYQLGRGDAREGDCPNCESHGVKE